MKPLWEASNMAFAIGLKKRQKQRCKTEVRRIRSVEKKAKEYLRKRSKV